MAASFLVYQHVLSDLAELKAKLDVQKMQMQASQADLAVLYGAQIYAHQQSSLSNAAVHYQRGESLRLFSGSYATATQNMECHTASYAATGSYETAVPNKPIWDKPKQEAFKLTRHNSPLLAAHNRWMGAHWRFDSPFAGLYRWFLRFAWRATR